jgi:hypothetical protein
MSDTIPTKAAAEACETTPRTLRVFLRASKDYEAVGSGGRYAFTEDDLPELKTRFATWLAEREAAAKAKEKAAKEAEEKAAAASAGEGKDGTQEPEGTDDKPAEEAKPRTRARKTTAA